MSKRALIFSPYLDSFGGGEWYTLKVADCLLQKKYAIDLAWKNTKLTKAYQDRFGIDVSRFTVKPELYSLFSKKSQPLQTWQNTKGYDLIFFVSDGSIPFLFGQKNWLHFQVPFTSLRNSAINRLKLVNQTILCNSEFTKSVIDAHLHSKSQVLYPPVEMKQAGQKKKIILGVGRFTSALHNKRQDILINAFKTLVDSGLQGWKLVLIGSQTEGESMVAQLQKEAQGYPIDIKRNVTLAQLNQAYSTASIFWHAAGFDVDEVLHPEVVEHFGIVTVEAMSAGCIPVVVNKGGQKEIISLGNNGYVFDSIEELVNQTRQIINFGQKKTEQLRKHAQDRAKSFSTQNFCHNIDSLL